MLKKPFSPVSRLHGHDKHAACSARTAPGPGPAAAAPAGTNGSGREKGGRDGAAPRSLPAASPPRAGPAAPALPLLTACGAGAAQRGRGRSRRPFAASMDARALPALAATASGFQPPWQRHEQRPLKHHWAVRSGPVPDWPAGRWVCVTYPALRRLPGAVVLAGRVRHALP